MRDKPFVIDEEWRRKAEAEGWLGRGWPLTPREDLYTRLWSTPDRTLAEEFGISDVMLGKLCRELQIPKPPRGHWRCVATGQKSPRPRLRAVRDDQPSILVVPPPPKRAPVPPSDPDLAARIAHERAPEHRIVVADDLRSPHPLVRQTRQLLSRVKPDDTGLLPRPRNDACLDINDSKAVLPRALLLMNALLKALESRGYAITIAGEGARHTNVAVGNEQVELRLAERVDRQETERAKHAKPNQFLWGSERWISTPTGQLTLTIGGSYGPGIKKWRDSDTKPLEDQLNDVVIGLMKTAEIYRVRALVWAEEARQREEAERKRRETERLRREEEERRHALEEQAERWSKSQRLRTFLQACEARLCAERGTIAPDSPEAAWLRWAHVHADRLDPLRQGYLEKAVADLHRVQQTEGVS
nr:MAG: hypothetical protein DIU80_02565 [Chloroflexota bacterium]